ncbi:MAG TPA: hypothetical protein VGG48_04535 [Rhizomicrobium sp.]
MRIFLAGLSLLVLATAASAAPHWLLFHDPDGMFSVNFPRAPAVSHESTPNTSDNTTVDMLEYTIDDGDTAMIVIVSDLTRYPDADPSKVIEGAVGGAKGSAVQTLSDHDIRLGGHSGREVVLLDKDSNNIEDDIFFVNGKLYQVMYVLPVNPAAGKVDDVRRFEASFRFTH